MNHIMKLNGQSRVYKTAQSGKGGESHIPELEQQEPRCEVNIVAMLTKLEIEVGPKSISATPWWDLPL